MRPTNARDLRFLQGPGTTILAVVEMGMLRLAPV